MMKEQIKILIKFYQDILYNAETNYDPSNKKSWENIQYLGNIVDRLHDVRMYQAWIDEEKA